METNNLNQTMSNETHMNEIVTLPRPRMSFKEAVSTCFGKYATFKGRARRSEYWWFSLFGLIVFVVLLGPALALMYLEESCGVNMDGGLWTFATVVSAILALIGMLAFLGMIIPCISVEVRRLHDTGRSGWWVFWSLIVAFVAGVVPYFVFGFDKASDMGEIQTFTSAFELALLPGMFVAISTLCNWILEIVILVFTLFDSHKHENQYGPSPKYQ